MAIKKKPDLRSVIRSNNSLLSKKNRESKVKSAKPADKKKVASKKSPRKKVTPKKKVYQNKPQSPTYNKKADAKEKSKPSGWRFTEEGAAKLGVKSNATPTADQIEKYNGKHIGRTGKRYIYIERRKDKSDISKRPPYLEKGGLVNERKNGYFNADGSKYINLEVPKSNSNRIGIVTDVAIEKIKGRDTEIATIEFSDYTERYIFDRKEAKNATAYARGGDMGNGESSTLRSLKVTYSDGSHMETSMAAHLTDKQMLDYFKPGQEFNIGRGENDKMVKVVSAEITDGRSIGTKVDLFKINKSYEKGDRVAYKDIDGQYTKIGYITKVYPQDGVTLYYVDGASYMADELRPVVEYADGGHISKEEYRDLRDKYDHVSELYQDEEDAEKRKELKNQLDSIENAINEYEHKDDSFETGGTVGVFSKGDEGMFEGGEYRILKVEPHWYHIHEIDEDGSLSLFVKPLKIKKSTFESSFALFPNDDNNGVDLNINVFGYQTQNFDISPISVEQFNAVMLEVVDDNAKQQALSGCAEEVDKVLAVEKDRTKSVVDIAAKYSEAMVTAAYYNYRTKIKVNLYTIFQHSLTNAIKGIINNETTQSMPAFEKGGEINYPEYSGVTGYGDSEKVLKSVKPGERIRYAKFGTIKKVHNTEKGNISFIVESGGNEVVVMARDVLFVNKIKNGKHTSIEFKSGGSVDGELSPRAEWILDQSEQEYNDATPARKKEMIAHVKAQLVLDEKGNDLIGIGLDKDMVSAGTEFLKKHDKPLSKKAK